MTRFRTLVAAMLTACFVAGCASPSGNSDIGLERVADTGVDSGGGVEQGSPRERAKAHTDLAGAYYQLGNLAVALEELRIAIGADPGYAQAYNVLGLVHAELRENSQATASFERALRIDPTDPDINHNYALFLCGTDREELSLRYFMAAVRNPLYATPQKSYTLAAACALRKNLEADAVAYYDRALRLDPTYAAAMIGFAQLKFRRGEMTDAKSLVDRFNRIAEPTSESLWLALRIARAVGDRNGEASYTGQLRRLFAGSPEYQKLLRGQYD